MANWSVERAKVLKWFSVFAVGLVLASVEQAQANTVRIEAESMSSVPSSGGYKTESVSTSSGGVVMNLKGGATNGHTATLSTAFSGATGTYDIVLGYHDEQDGHSTLTTFIDSQQIDTFVLDMSGLGNQPSATNFLTRQVGTGIQVANGDLVEITGVQATWDHANVDYIEFVATGAPSNQAPTVDAGTDQSITLQSTLSLSGSANDDGEPSPPALTTTWSTESGPAAASFADSSAVTTTATFSQAGTYVLRLTADDGELSAFDDVTITVGSPPTSTVRIEAESMTSAPSSGGYKTENLSSASGGVVMNLKGSPADGHTAALSTTFTGDTGSYDVFLGYHDEQDGLATLTTRIDGQQIDSFILDTAGLGTQPSATNFLIRQVGASVVIANGDLIEITGVQGNWDNANIDYIEFVALGSTPIVPSIAVFSSSPAVEGFDSLRFFVNLSETTTANVQVDYVVDHHGGGGSASSDDYVASSGTIVVPPNSVQESVTVSVVNDSIAESNELVRITLSNPQNATLTNAVAYGTIVDDETSGPPTPTGLTGPATDNDGSYTISWSYVGGPVGDVAYQLEQQFGSGGWILQVASTYSNSSQRNVSASGAYSYRVRSCDPDNLLVCSGWSNIHTVQVDLGSQGALPSEPPTANPYDPTQVAPAVSDTVGTTAGSFRVDESGAATYTIPIATASGTAGVAPQISLNYSSSGGNGLLGIGWSIGGLSAITRCRKTFNQDRAVTALSMSSTDRFCLDGQRLLLTSAGSYGDAGSTYRSEIDNGSIVTIDAVANGEPVSFSVKRKDGSTSYYGEAPGSSDESAKLKDAVGRTLTWSLRRFADSVGNPIWFNYTSTAGAQRISEIRWAYGTSAGPNSGYNARLVFNYESRTDKITGYVAGSLYSTDQRLASVDSRNTAPGHSDTVIRTYHLNYNENISVNDELSRLTSIQECVGSTCLQNKTTFSWIEPTTAGLEQSIDTFEMGSDMRAFQPADIDGDGQMDLAWVQGTGATKTLRYALSSAGTYSITAFADGSSSQSVHVGTQGTLLRSFDYNLDGRQDVAYFDTNIFRWRIFLAEPYGAGEWRLNPLEVDTPLDVGAITFVDADSNGTTDAVYPRDETPVDRLYVRRLLPAPGASPSSATYYHFADERLIAGSDGIDTYGEIVAIAPDLNADGRVDVIVGGTGEVCNHEDPDNCTSVNNAGRALTLAGVENDSPSLSVYHHFTSVDISGSRYYPMIDEVQVADLDQDGLSDLFYPLSAPASDEAVRFDYRINKGDGTFEDPVSLPGPSILEQEADVQIVDWNMDGYPDVLWRSTGGGGLVHVRYWNPDTRSFGDTHTAVSSVSGAAAETARFFDVNGDAVPDVLRINRNGSAGSTEVVVRQSAGSNVNVAVNRIDEIVNGLGAGTEIDYEPLSWSSHYKRLQVTTTPDTERVCEGSQNYEVCYDVPIEVANKDDFYEAINSDWDYPMDWQTLGKTSPVLEMSGPMYVVTRVRGDAPQAGIDPANPLISAKSSIAYHYTEGKVQAGGRGFLGFMTLTTVDEQSGIETTTRYRQDWPFTGLPIGTFSDSSNGTLLSTSSSEWSVEEWASDFPQRAAVSGSASLGSMHVLQTKSIDRTYSLVDDGLTAGVPLSSVTTDTDYDEEGNAKEIIVTTRDGNENILQTVKTTNTYYNSSNSIYTLIEGRLGTTLVTTSRPGLADLSRYSTFAYHSTGAHRGLLWTETVEPLRPELRVATVHTYDSVGNLTQSRVHGGSVIRCGVDTVSYDTQSWRYVDETRDCLGRVTSRVQARNEHGSPTDTQVFIDANGVDYVRERAIYSTFGREYYRHSSNGAWTTQYLTNSLLNCPAGSVTKAVSTASTGAETQTCADKLGRDLRTMTLGFDGSWYAQDTQYDEYGRVRFKSEPYTLGPQTPTWTTQQYDILGRPTVTTLPDLSTSMTTYTGDSSAGLTTTVKNDLLQERTEIRNVLGEITDVFDHENGHTQFAYDIQGNMSSMTDDQLNQTTMKYDDLGRKIEMTDPDKGFWQYDYNNFGELIEQTDAKGQVQEMDYDHLGRMISRTSPDEDARWVYDTAPYGLGQLSVAYDAESGYIQVFSYDTLGRTSETTTSIGNYTYFEKATYDEHGRTFQVFDAAGDSSFTDHGVVHRYNAYGYLDRIADVIDVSGAPREIYQEVLGMNARGQITVQHLNDGKISTSFGYYDETGRMRTIDSMDTGVGTVFQDLTYVWDTLGNLKSREDERGPGSLLEDFTYDDLNRLKTYAVSGQGTTTVSYNSIGNVTSKSDVESGATYDYTSAGGPHSVGSIGSISYAYDDNGNMISGDGRTINYTAFDKPYSISKGGHTTEFDYGPDRNRYRRVDSGTGGTTVTHYVGSVEVIRRPDFSWERKRYIGGVAIETVYFGTDSIEDSRETQYRLNDHLGSLGVVVSSTGGIEQEFAFDPWGQRRNAQNWAALSSVELANFDASITTRGFTDHEMLDEVGIIHMNGRIYDPKIARFVQADPFVQDPTNTQSLNRYSYVLNNPLNATDPSGYFVFQLAASFVLKYAEKLAWQEVAFLFAAAGTADAIVAGADFEGALLSGVSSAAFASLGTSFAKDGVFADASGIARTAAFGTLGGITAVLQGGKFGHGFRSSVISASVGGVAGDIAGRAGSGVEVIARVVAGGTVSELTGGKFANGAAYAAFSIALDAGVQAFRRPTPQEITYARLAEGVYDPEFEGVDGYTKVGGTFKDSDTGLQAALFVNEAGHEVLAFAGTNGAAPDNWKANFRQAFGFESEQYDQAIELAQNHFDAAGGNIHFVGHSLGGGLASAAAVWTGGDATVFNAAGLHSNTIGTHVASNANVTYFYSSVDVLRLGNALTPTRVPGNRVSVGVAGFHRMDSLCKAMGC